MIYWIVFLIIIVLLFTTLPKIYKDGFSNIADAFLDDD